MNEKEQALYEALFSRAVADREAVRSRVLALAHQEAAAPRDARPAAEAAPRPALQAVPRRPGRLRRAVLIPLAACAAFVVLLNVSAPFARAVEQVPGLRTVARLVTFRQWEFSNQDAAIQGSQPAVEGTGNTSFESSVNALIDEKLSDLNAQAKADAAEYRQNWLAMGNSSAEFLPLRYSFDYETYYADKTRLSFLIRQRETIPTAGEDVYTTLFYYNLDVATGADLTLAELLGPDWKTAVSAAVDRQIRGSGDARKISYYQEFWVDKNVPWDDSQKFYLNADGQVTVVLDEGWIAPFEDGPQSFVIGPPVSSAAR
ncbi:MAG: RsiV family protein [Oscillibacter sp.]|jgi:hypothetical protein|nr:RsiV family protein [Oscillibacter sp.]